MDKILDGSFVESLLRWFIGSINHKGIFHYLYDPALDTYSPKNNAIRQLMASRLLAELAGEDISLQQAHRKNLDFLFKHWIKQKGELSFVVLYGNSKLGANAMMLRTLLASPFYDEYRNIAESLMRTLVSLIERDGSMKPFLLEPPYEFDADYLLTFYSGEALVALLELYRREPRSELLEVIERSQRFYINKYVTNMEVNYYPAYVPWHSMSLNWLYKITGKQIYAQSVFALSDKLLEIQDRTEHVGRFYNPHTPQYGSPHASSDGVYCEGLAYALETAIIAREELRIFDYREALELGFRHLATLQYTPANSDFLKQRERALGGLRIRRTNLDEPFSERQGSNIRIDSNQHTLDAIRKIMDVRKIYSSDF